MNARRAAAVLCAAAVTFAAAVRADAGPFDPALRFRVLTTPHFVIYFHQQEEALAEALAARAEEIHASLVPLLGVEPGARTHVVLVHQDDVPNGTAAVLPQNTIVIHAAPPPGVSFLGNTSDWLRQVFTHEYAHILHLDRSRGWASVARAIFGRSPIAFPNLTLPAWQIEGLATFAESRLGEGRLHARDFTALVDRAAVEGRFEPLDRVNGGLVDWPGPQGWYAYGALFHEFVVERYGADTVRRLADRTSGRVPYFTSGAFEPELGRSLGELWQEFEQARAAHRQAGGSAGERLTHLGFSASAPRLDRDGAVLFTSATPDGLPKVRRLPLEGGGEPEQVFERFGGAGLAIAGHLVVFDQLELVRNTGLASDLYSFERSTGRTRRLTREARLVDPDLSPDGTRLAAVQIVPGGRQLLILDARALLRAPSPATPDRLPVLARVGEPGNVFAGPRWSPDGTQLAAERGPLPSSIVVSTATGAVVTELRVSGGRHVTPAWGPDGRLLFAADDEGSTFQVFAASRDDGSSAWSVVQLTRTSGGLRDPLPLGDGGLLGVGYGVDGFDLRRLRAEDQLSLPVPLQPVPARVREDERTTRQGEEYRPWPTLLPRGWTPLVERRDGRWRVGASTYGVDVLGRHAATATATWAVSGGPENGNRLLSPARPDWTASYAYLRWRPAWTIDVSDRASIFDVFTTDGGVVPVVQREREVNAGVLYPIRRTTKALAFRGMFHHGDVTARSADDEAQATRAGVRASFSAVTARRYGYSISPEDGMAFALTGEWFRPAFGSDGRADAITADWRGYFSPGDTHIVLALRAAGAASFGDEQTRRAFRLGGADGNAALGSFDSDSIGLLRGFQDGAFAGSRVALANLELRVPLWRPQRGLGTWPLFLRNVHTAGFVDAGHAWSGAARWSDRKIGAGVELSADFVAGYGAPLTVTAGTAWGYDGARQATRGAEIYLRLGQAF